MGSINVGSRFLNHQAMEPTLELSFKEGLLASRCSPVVFFRVYRMEVNCPVKGHWLISLSIWKLDCSCTPWKGKLWEVVCTPQLPVGLDEPQWVWISLWLPPLPNSAAAPPFHKCWPSTNNLHVKPWFGVLLKNLTYDYWFQEWTKKVTNKMRVWCCISCCLAMQSLLMAADRL